MHPIWFVLGISGAGKTYFSQAAARSLSWFHYEIDQTPHDGITHWGLRNQWEAFLHSNQIEPLAQELAARSCAAGCPGSILSFPGNLVAYITEQQVATALQAVKFIVLSGPALSCRHAFLRREYQSGRGLTELHWAANNEHLYPMLSSPWIAPYVHEAFMPDGSRKPFDILLGEVRDAA